MKPKPFPISVLSISEYILIVSVFSIERYFRPESFNCAHVFFEMYKGGVKFDINLSTTGEAVSLTIHKLIYRLREKRTKIVRKRASSF